MIFALSYFKRHLTRCERYQKLCFSKNAKCHRFGSILWINLRYFCNKLYLGTKVKNRKFCTFISRVPIITKFYFYSEIMNAADQEIPLVDRQYALQILFELAIQRGTITAMLDMILLLLNLSEKNDLLASKKSAKEENSYPLVPFLKRFQQVLRSTFLNLNGYDIWSEKDSDDIAVS